MRVEVKVPQLPESVAEATLVNWHKKVGEAVARDENLVDVETDKVVLELPAPQAGVLVEIRQADGATVTGQEVIAVIDTDAAAVTSPAAAASPAGTTSPAAAASAAAATSTAAVASPAAPPSPTAAAAPAALPAARKMMADLAVNPATFPNSMVPAYGCKRIHSSAAKSLKNFSGSAQKTFSWARQVRRIDRP